MSGLPVSMSNACAPPVAPSIARTASAVARRRKIPGVAILGVCCMTISLELVEFFMMNPLTNRVSRRAAGFGCATDQGRGCEIEDPREQLTEFLVVVDGEARVAVVAESAIDLHPVLCGQVSPGCGKNDLRFQAHVLHLKFGKTLDSLGEACKACGTFALVAIDVLLERFDQRCTFDMLALQLVDRRIELGRALAELPEQVGVFLRVVETLGERLDVMQ